MARLLRDLVQGGSIAVALWVLAWLLVIDAGVNWALGSNTPSAEPSALKRYFEYGRSIEGKLDRMAAADPKKGGQMLSTGWVDEAWLRSLPAQPLGDDDLLVAIYGQSFSYIATREAARLDSKITVRGVGGPGAPPSHSYAAYKADVSLRKADVVVFGVLSSAVANMGSMSGLIWGFENPAPFTFPRYRVLDGRLTEVVPLIRSEAEFREAFTGRTDVWRRFKEQLRASDRGYDPLTFDASWADSSSIARLLRRGWVAHGRVYEDGVLQPGEGFNPDSEEIKALRAMLVDLSQRTRERGEHLIVLLLHTMGHANYLDRVLEETLKSNRIEYISTHALFSSGDPSNFLFDGHYSEEANLRLSKTLLAAMRRERPTGSGPNEPATGER